MGLTSFLFFKPKRLRVLLETASVRITRMVCQRRNAVKVLHRTVAELVAAKKFDSARIKVEEAIRQEMESEAMETLQLYCDLLSHRVILMESAKGCPAELREAIGTLCYASYRVQVDELVQARKQFGYKFGKDEIKRMGLSRGQVQNGEFEGEPPAEIFVNHKVASRLEMHIPPPALCVERLGMICQEFSVPWDAEEATAQMEFSSLMAEGTSSNACPEPASWEKLKSASSLPFAPAPAEVPEQQQPQHHSPGPQPPSGGTSGNFLSGAPQQPPTWDEEELLREISDSGSSGSGGGAGGGSSTAPASGPPPPYSPPAMQQERQGGMPPPPPFCDSMSVNGGAGGAASGPPPPPVHSSDTSSSPVPKELSLAERLNRLRQ